MVGQTFRHLVLNEPGQRHLTLYRYLFPAMWISWVIYWRISARTVKPNVRQESLSSRLSCVGPLVLAGFLFLPHNIPMPLLSARFVPQTPWSFAVAASLTFVGLLVTLSTQDFCSQLWDPR